MMTGYTAGVYFKMVSEHGAKAAKKRSFRTLENRNHGG